jgi:hypothetical protein
MKNGYGWDGRYIGLGSCICMRLHINYRSWGFAKIYLSLIPNGVCGCINGTFFCSFNQGAEIENNDRCCKKAAKRRAKFPTPGGT